MENKRQGGGSPSSRKFDHLFGPKDSSSSSSSSTSAILGSMFPPLSTVHGRDSSHTGIMGSQRKQGESSKMESSRFSSKDNNSIYQNESAEPCYFSSSIYYGGQENYSPRTKTTESQPVIKKDGGEDDSNGNNANSASRGNWWQGSLYY